ncbi:MAG: zf-TFIIB domain-containing protein [Chloroflexota bacterium]|nr:zf-TFIIB domain-containing protein [Chloroflexota bacterium]
MKCPTDGTALVMSDRHGIEIDYCPQCRGIWLDRGELDKIIERAAAYEQQAVQRAAPQTAASQPPAMPQPGYPPQPPKPGYPPQPGMVVYDDDYWEDYHKRTGHYPKKKTFLGEMFDIFD